MDKWGISRKDDCISPKGNAWKENSRSAGRGGASAVLPLSSSQIRGCYCNTVVPGGTSFFGSEKKLVSNHLFSLK